MPSTHLCLNIHLVFGTKNREPMISAEWMGNFHAYIRKQAEHHRIKTFREEYLDFLKRVGVEYDERYVWD